MYKHIFLCTIFLTSSAFCMQQTILDANAVNNRREQQIDHETQLAIDCRKAERIRAQEEDSSKAKGLRRTQSLPAIFVTESYESTALVKRTHSAPVAAKEKVFYENPHTYAGNYEPAPKTLDLSDEDIDAMFFEFKKQFAQTSTSQPSQIPKKAVQSCNNILAHEKLKGMSFGYNFLALFNF